MRFLSNLVPRILSLSPSREKERGPWEQCWFLSCRLSKCPKIFWLFQRISVLNVWGRSEVFWSSEVSWCIWGWLIETHRFWAGNGSFKVYQLKFVSQAWEIKLLVCGRDLAQDQSFRRVWELTSRYTLQPQYKLKNNKMKGKVKTKWKTNILLFGIYPVG